MESRLTASGGRGCYGVEGLSKKEKGLMDIDNSVVIMAEEGVGKGGRGYKRDE